MNYVPAFDSGAWFGTDIRPPQSQQHARLWDLRQERDSQGVDIDAIHYKLGAVKNADAEYLSWQR